MWVMIFFCLFPPRPSFLCVFRGGKKIDLRRVFVVGPHRPGKKKAIVQLLALHPYELICCNDGRRESRKTICDRTSDDSISACAICLWIQLESRAADVKLNGLREKEGKSCANVYDVLFIKLRSGRLFKDGQKSERGIRQLSAVNAIERRRGKKVDGHTWHLNHPRAIRQRVDRRLAKHLNKKLLGTMISKRLHHHHLERVNSANGEKNLQIKWRNLSLSTANLFNFAIILL